jgi:hypothetical protein
MAVIYLRHPVHGTKVACLDSEAEYDKMNDWEEFDPTQPSDNPVNSLVREPKRRGRPRKELSNGDGR